MYTLLSLRLHSSDLNAIDAGLSDKVQQAPGFFSNTPVVIDITRIEGDSSIDGEGLIERVKAHKLIPVLVSVTDSESPVAQQLSLPIVETTSRNVPLSNNLAGTKKSGKASKQSKTAGEKASLLHERKIEPVLAHADGDDSLDNSAASDSIKGEDSASESNGSDDTGSSDAIELGNSLSSHMDFEPVSPRLITRPVRSGQQLYARATDLIIMAHVGPGAEVVADNNIHVYGPLRGRALCGVTGNTESRIFCQSLEAELVSVAGNYKLLEEIPEDLRGKPAQIWYQEGRLNIDPL